MVLMVLMVLVVAGAEEGLIWRSPGLSLTFCLLLGGDVSSSIWLCPGGSIIISPGCIFPVSCKNPLSFTHFLPFPSISQLTSVSGPDTDTGLEPWKFSLNSAKLGLCWMEAAKLLSVRNEEETGEGRSFLVRTEGFSMDSSDRSLPRILKFILVFSWFLGGLLWCLGLFCDLISLGAFLSKLTLLMRSSLWCSVLIPKLSSSQSVRQSAHTVHTNNRTIWG